MAITFDQLARDVERDLLGYSLDQASIAELAAPMTDTDTTFVVDAETAENLSQGLVEIDDELILVKTYDSGSGTVQVMGGVNGRGARGTVAAAHSSGSLITVAPAFPRYSIKKAINDTIRNLYPHLLVFAATTFTRNAAVYGYELPADVREVWYVRGRDVGPTATWRTLANWRFHPKAVTTDFPTGKAIEIYDIDWITPGQSVQVVYGTEPSVLVNDADDFATTTGYAERIAELVRWGACSKLLPAYEAARLQQQAVESTERAPLVREGSAIKAAQYYLAMYQTRLEEERSLMFQEIENFATYQGS